MNKNEFQKFMNEENQIIYSKLPNYKSYISNIL